MPNFGVAKDVLNLIIVVLGVFAIIQAEGTLRLVFAALLLALLFGPGLGNSAALAWIGFIGKFIFGVGCYIYLKAQDFWSFGK